MKVLPSNPLAYVMILQVFNDLLVRLKVKSQGTITTRGHTQATTL